jgi:hypothetical protein
MYVSIHIYQICIHINKYTKHMYKGWIDADLCQRIISLTKRAGLPIDLHNPYTEEELGKYMYMSTYLYLIIYICMCTYIHIWIYI